tara:strand:- start:944 stop:1105 length:162 start_codon:yes stop_codon:yes gene_type:complete
MEVSKQATKMVEYFSVLEEGNSSKALLWILGSMVVLGVVLDYNNEMKSKKTTR